MTKYKLLHFYDQFAPCQAAVQPGNQFAPCQAAVQPGNQFAPCQAAVQPGSQFAPCQAAVQPRADANHTRQTGRKRQSGELNAFTLKYNNNHNVNKQSTYQKQKECNLARNKISRLFAMPTTATRESTQSRNRYWRPLSKGRERSNQYLKIKRFAKKRSGDISSSFKFFLLFKRKASFQQVLIENFCD